MQKREVIIAKWAYPLNIEFQERWVLNIKETMQMFWKKILTKNKKIALTQKIV